MLSEVQQRSFLERSMRDVIAAIGRPETVNLLGSEEAGQLSDAAERCTFAYNDGGIVDTGSLGRDSIPVATVSGDETVRFKIEPGEALFTPRQVSAAAVLADRLSAQSPKILIGGIAPEDILKRIANSLTTPQAEDQSRFSLQPNTNRLTLGVRSTLVPVGHSGSDEILGIARITGRPAMIFPYKRQGRVEPDVFAHEIRHAVQKEAAPVTVYKSDSEVISDAIGRELDGYHTGAMVRRSVSNLDDSRLAALLEGGVEALRPKYFQLFIDTIRSQRAPIGDPYRASGTLLRIYSGYGVDTKGLMSNYFSLPAMIDYFKNQATN